MTRHNRRRYSFLVMAVLLFEACASSYRVRCDKHLVPINPPQVPINPPRQNATPEASK